ncbi:MAG: hypothetical protein NZT61_07870, partial [Deltaproteobacteria bacterium]|nr:hypothetical protein [Deltaproteobacteria bacterium]
MEIRVLIGFFLSYTVCLWTQNSLCDEPRVYNNDSLIRAKRVILNYLDLDERAFRLNQNIDQLDGEFLCALEVIKKNGADPELQLRLIHFIPKPWNTKDWLLKAYTGIAALVRKEVLEGRINNLRGQKNSVFPRFLKLIEKIKVARLSESEIDYLAAILREFPYFVVSDFLKRLASKSSKAFQNVLFLIASLERNNYFLNKHRVIQIYQSIHGTCEKVPDISPWIFLSCKNKVPKEKITVEADYFF